MKKDIRAYGYDRLKEEMLAIGEKAFRSKQIYEWLHVKLADDFDAAWNQYMADFAQKVRNPLTVKVN